MTDTLTAPATGATSKPTTKPARPFFSSGPCAKPPGWDAVKLANASLGRSHRSKIGKQRLQYAIDLMRAVLKLPETHRIGIVPGSDTGAFEMAMWTMLGARGVTTLAWESFGEGWVTDAVKQLKIDPIVMRADYGKLPDLHAVDWSTDVLFTWNGTTSGVRVPDADWIPDDREGLSIADATSGVFAYDIDWTKIDVATFSWQKVLGGEGAHGVLILGPRAVERLESYTPAWPLPKLFRLVSKGKLTEGIFKGETINTPSMLAVEDAIFALEWAKGLGEAGLIARSDANAAALPTGPAGFIAPPTRPPLAFCMTATSPGNRLPSVSRGLQLVAVLLLGIIALVTLQELTQFRAGLISDAMRQMTRLDMVFAEQTGRAVETVDLILRDAILPTPPAELDAMLRRRVEGVRQVSNVAVYDAAGTLVASSRPPDLRRPLSAAGRTLLAFHAANPTPDLQISEPLREDDGPWITLLSRRITGPDGSFRGMAAAALSNAASTSASEVTLTLQNTPPISDATFSPVASLKSKMATLTPAAARARDVASPRPEAPPVTIAETEESSFMGRFLGARP